MRYVLSLLFAGLAFAQTPEVGGVTGGLIYDPPTRSLRTIRGVLGAAYMGPAVTAGIDAAFVSPDGAMALSRRGDGLSLHRFRNSSQINEQSVGSLEGITEECLSGWSADNKIAVLACSVTGIGTRVYKIGTDAAAVNWRADIASAVRFAGVAKDNSVVLGIKGDAPGVYSVASDGALRPIANVRGIEAGVVDARSNTAYLVESETAALFRIGLQNGSREMIWQLASEWLGSLAGIGTSGSRIAIAERSTATVHVIDTARFIEAAAVSLDALPQKMSAAGAPGLWLLNSRQADGSGSAFVVDVTTGNAFFVPAGEGN